MRVKPRHADLRRIYAKQINQRLVQQIYRLEHTSDRKTITQIHQRQMYTGQGHTQPTGCKHHRKPFGLELLGKQLGMPGMFYPRLLP